MRQLVIEYINEFKLMVYTQAWSNDGWIHFFTEPRLYFDLQTILDGGIFLRVRTGDGEILMLDQRDAFFFLENILEYEGYYTRDGLMRPDDKKEVFCVERYINMRNRLQELLDIREQMLYWISYGNIGEDFNGVSS